MKKTVGRRNRSQYSGSNSYPYFNMALGVIVLVFILYKSLPSYIFITRPQPSLVAATYPDTSRLPIQTDITADEVDEHRIRDIFIEGSLIKIKPVATYEINARVVSKRNYTEDWDGELMPVDLALAWGDLAKEEYHQFMNYHHSDRYFSWRSSRENKLNKNYIISHSANVHFISPNKNIENALISVGTDDRVRIKGYLVNVEGPSGQVRRTSLIRDDIGSGACENVYITKLQIGNEVFE